MYNLSHFKKVSAICGMTTETQDGAEKHTRNASERLNLLKYEYCHADFPEIGLYAYRYAETR